MSFPKEMHDYEKQQIIDKLIGAEIIGAIEDETGEFFGFRVMDRDGDTVLVWVERDEEGNGAGHLKIESLKPED